jgi:hypothetical protein
MLSDLSRLSWHVKVNYYSTLPLLSRHVKMQFKYSCDCLKCQGLFLKTVTAVLACQDAILKTVKIVTHVSLLLLETVAAVLTCQGTVLKTAVTVLAIQELLLKTVSAVSSCQGLLLDCRD